MPTEEDRGRKGPTANSPGRRKSSIAEPWLSKALNSPARSQPVCQLANKASSPRKEVSKSAAEAPARHSSSEKKHATPLTKPSMTSPGIANTAVSVWKCARHQLACECRQNAEEGQGDGALGLESVVRSIWKTESEREAVTRKLRDAGVRSIATLRKCLITPVWDPKVSAACYYREAPPLLNVLVRERSAAGKIYINILPDIRYTRHTYIVYMYIYIVCTYVCVYANISMCVYVLHV